MISTHSVSIFAASIVLVSFGLPVQAQYAQRANQARQQFAAHQAARPVVTPASARNVAPRYNRASAMGAGSATNTARTLAGTATFTGGHSRAARPVAGMASMRGLSTGMVAFAADMGRLPTTAEGLGALVRKPAGARNWRGPYVTQGFGQLPNVPNPFVDPWGHYYQYSSTTNGGYSRFEIRSAGPDGLLNTADDIAIEG